MKLLQHLRRASLHAIIALLNTSLIASPLLAPMPAAAQPYPTVVSGNITTLNLAPTGVATAGSALEIVTVGKATVGVQVLNTWVGTLSAYCTIEGNTWVLNSWTPVTANGISTINVAGCQKARVSASAWTSGTAGLTLHSEGVSGSSSSTGGDASAANQATANASLASIDGKTPALGQAVAGSSSPVVLPAAQITTLTPPAAITGFATAVKQPALGTAGSPSTDVLSVQGVASGTPMPISAATLPLPTGAATSSNQPALVSGRVPVDPSGVTSPVSAASLPLPSGAATDATLATTNTSIGATNEIAAASNGATSGLNGLWRRFLGFFTSTAPSDANRLPVSPPDGLAATGTMATNRTATVTISNASPGVVTWTANGLPLNESVILTTSGTLPTGLTANNTVYVKTILTADTFTVSLTPGGAAINTSSAGSGTHTADARVMVLQTATGYNSGTVHFVGGSGTVAWEFSNDQTTWFGPTSWKTTDGGSSGGASSTSTMPSAYQFPAWGTYFRVRASNYSSGTLTVATTLNMRAVSTNVVAANVANTVLVQNQTEDLPAASGAVGMFTLGVRRDNLAVSTSNDGDYGEMATSKWAAVLVKQENVHAKTYTSTLNVAAAASATDIATICGNATTPAYVSKVFVSGQQTTAGLVDALLIKRSTADTGGTSGAGTAIPHDSGDSAANSAVLGYTANPTTGTAIGTMRRTFMPVGGATSLTNAFTSFDFGDRGKEVVLKTTSECLAVNLNGATLTGGTFSVTFEWTEKP